MVKSQFTFCRFYCFPIVYRQCASSLSASSARDRPFIPTISPLVCLCPGIIILEENKKYGWLLFLACSSLHRALGTYSSPTATGCIVAQCQDDQGRAVLHVHMSVPKEGKILQHGMHHSVLLMIHRVTTWEEECSSVPVYSLVAPHWPGKTPLHPPEPKWTMTGSARESPRAQCHP